jgi:hypothetical protein
MYKKQGCWVGADRETDHTIGCNGHSGRLVALVNCALPVSVVSVFLLLSLLPFSFLFFCHFLGLCHILSFIPSSFPFSYFYSFLSIHLSFCPSFPTRFQTICIWPSHNGRPCLSRSPSLKIEKSRYMRSPSSRYEWLCALPFNFWNIWPIFTKLDMNVMPRPRQRCIIYVISYNL